MSPDGSGAKAVALDRPWREKEEEGVDGMLMVVKAGIEAAFGVSERARVLPPPRDSVDCLDMVVETMPGRKRVGEIL